MNNQQVAHEWASQNKQGAKGSHFYFEGRTIFSYGEHFPIAHWLDSETVLFTSEGYSVTTAKHKGYVSSAIPSGVTVFTVPKVSEPYDHEANALYLANAFKEAREKALHAVKNVEPALRATDEALRSLWEYFKRYGSKIENKKTRAEIDALRRRALFTKKELAELDKKKARAAELERTAQARREACEAKEREAAALDLEKWRKGEFIQNGHFHALPCAIRCREGQLETSHGARVPFLDGLNLFQLWRAGGAKPGDTVGLYRVNEVYEDRLVIGCHTIAREEAERFFSGN